MPPGMRRLRKSEVSGALAHSLADRIACALAPEQIRNLEIGESEKPQERTRRALEDALGTATPEADEEVMLSDQIGSCAWRVLGLMEPAR